MLKDKMPQALEAYVLEKVKVQLPPGEVLTRRGFREFFHRKIRLNDSAIILSLLQHWVKQGEFVVGKRGWKLPDEVKDVADTAPGAPGAPGAVDSQVLEAVATKLKKEAQA